MERFEYLRFADIDIEAIDAQIADLQKVCNEIETESLRKKYADLIQRLSKEREDAVLKKERIQKELDAIRQDNEEAYRIIYYRYVKGCSWMQTYMKAIPDVPTSDPVSYTSHYIVRYWEKYQQRN